MSDHGLLSRTAWKNVIIDRSCEGAPAQKDRVAFATNPKSIPSSSLPVSVVVAVNMSGGEFTSHFLHYFPHGQSVLIKRSIRSTKLIVCRLHIISIS